MASQTSIRRTLNRLAYASLALDVCIALITALGFFDVGSNHQSLLVPINYLLTVVVVLSIALFVLLLALRAKEKGLGRPQKGAQSGALGRADTSALG